MDRGCSHEKAAAFPCVLSARMADSVAAHVLISQDLKAVFMCVHVLLYVHTHICMQVCSSECVFVCMSVCVCMCVQMHVDICKHGRRWTSGCVYMPITHMRTHMQLCSAWCVYVFVFMWAHMWGHAHRGCVHMCMCRFSAPMMAC